MFDPTAFFTQYQALKGVKPETWDKLSQTWPARMAQSAWNAATLPGDVWNGKVDPLSEEGIGRATDLAGLTMSSTLASPRGSIGVGPVLPKKPNPMAVEPPTPMTMTPPQGIRAYHGSPHDFDKFDISKIGTGEGAQVYGHGLYFAENENTAKSYRTSNGPAWMSTAIASRVQNALNKFPNDKKAARQSLHDAAKAAPSQGERQMLYDAYNNFDSVASGAGGHMYEVRINAEPEHFLDWDKPRDQLSPKLQEWAAANHPDVWDKAADGASFYKHLQDKMTPPLPPDPPGTPKGWGFVQRGDEGQPRATQALRDAGIPGIRYLDQGSRGQGNGTFNYVVFNDALIDILKKYGIAGMAAAPVIAGAVNQQEPVANY